MVQLTNWNNVGRLFLFDIPNRLEGDIDNAVEQASEIYSNSIKQVIMEQPSDWTPKTEEWKYRSGSESLYIGATGQFFAQATDGNTRGLRAARGDRKVFVGARHDVGHHSGFSMQNIANILQATPDGSRDLFGRAYDRVEQDIERVFRRVGTSLR